MPGRAEGCSAATAKQNAVAHSAVEASVVLVLAAKGQDGARAAVGVAAMLAGVAVGPGACLKVTHRFGGCSSAEPVGPGAQLHRNQSVSPCGQPPDRALCIPCAWPLTVAVVGAAGVVAGVAVAACGARAARVSIRKEGRLRQECAVVLCAAPNSLMCPHPPALPIALLPSTHCCTARNGSCGRRGCQGSRCCGSTRGSGGRSSSSAGRGSRCLQPAIAAWAQLACSAR